ncbi:MAG: TetR/AcrR family transcriptional regulator [Acidimicrobiia bacterium]|nr:TetR/AcrR family transcriptional regulator [Acidimicrobiia bacterium]
MSPAATMDDTAATGALEQAADDLFYVHGVAGVSMAQIRDRSGVSLRRMYSICPSKSDLVSLWLRARHRVWMDGFSVAVSRNLATGSDPTDAVFDALASWMTATNFRGCGFINTHAESSELTEQHVEIIRGHKQSLARYLSSISADGDALAILVDGAIVQAAMFGSVEPIVHARRAARMMFEERP